MKGRRRGRAEGGLELAGISEASWKTCGSVGRSASIVAMVAGLDVGGREERVGGRVGELKMDARACVQ